MNETLGQRLARYRRQSGHTQETLAEACGWEGQSRISNYERDKNEPNLADLRLLASALRRPLIELIDGDSEHAAPKTDDYALIGQYSAKGSAGPGFLNEHVEVRGGLVFKRDWLARMNLKEQHLKVIYAQGSSMEPTISDGDVLLLDESQAQPLNRKVFAIQRPDGDLIIKRLIQTITNGWVIRSDNEDKRQYPDEIASDNEIGHLSILGRIVWHGGAL